jgi:membrane associated rhomboid family serine protease
MEPLPGMPPPPVQEHCYRHPNVPTGVHCTRCNRPICPDCMIPAPVGHHCPTCVGEARREFRKGPRRRIAVANAKAISVTKVLLASIAAVYVLEVASSGGAGSIVNGPSVDKLYQLGGSAAIGITARGFVNGGVATGQYWRLFTAMFLHAGILHIAFNAYALWIFGQVVEQELGRLRFATVYFVTGLFASAASYAFQPNPFTVGVGASGAIVGIFGAFVAFNWRRRHTALGAARLRSALLILVLNAVLNVGLAGAIDWRAHVGGLVSGLVAGFAAEGFGRFRNDRLTFVLGSVGLMAVTIGLVLWRTAQLKAQFPGL